MKRHPRFLALFTAVAVAFGGAATAVPAAAAPVAISAANFPGTTLDEANKQQISDVFKGINAFRKSKGLKPVRFNITVSEMAEDWSTKMASGNFRHNPHFADDSRVAGRWAAAAEIIAYRTGTSGQGLVDQWIASPGHNAIMSNAVYTEIGVGIRKSGGLVYGTVNFFTWQQGRAPKGSYANPDAFFKTQSTTTVTATKPAFSAAKNTVKIPKKTGVAYYVNGAKKAAGTYTYTGTGTVSAKASSGNYKLSGTKSWKFDNRNSVTATKPTFSAAKNAVKIPKKTGVAYYVNGAKKAAGTYTYTGTGTVSAKASSGSYKLSGKKSWKFSNGK